MLTRVARTTACLQESFSGDMFLSDPFSALRLETPIFLQQEVSRNVKEVEQGKCPEPCFKVSKDNKEGRLCNFFFGVQEVSFS